MEIENRKRLKKKFRVMVDNLLFSEIQDQLYEIDALDDEEVELIESKPTKKGQIRELIKIIKGKKGVFSEFCKVLRESPADYAYIADDLENAEIDDDDEDLVDGGEQSYKEKVEELMRQMWDQTQIMVDMQKQHNMEVEQLKEKLSSFPSEESSKRLSVRPEEADTVDGRFVEKYVAEFLRRPTVDDGFSLNRLMSRFRPRSLGEIENIACHLGIDIMQYFLKEYGYDITLQPEDEYTRTLRHMARMVLLSYGEEVKQCVAEMDKVEMNGYHAIDRLADEMFEDDKKVNWGRIVMWYTFWAQCVSSLPLSSDRLDENVNFYGNFVGFYLARRLYVWIAQEGGWVAFTKNWRFEENCPDFQRHPNSRSLIIISILQGLLEYYPFRP